MFIAPNDGPTSLLTNTVVTDVARSTKDLLLQASISSVDSNKETTHSHPADVVSKENLALLSERGRLSLLRFIQNDNELFQQANLHVYSGWPEAGI